MARFSHRMLAFVVILVLVTAGCNSSGELAKGLEYEGELNRTGSGFDADGAVYIYVINPDREITVQNLSLALYTAEGDLICEEPLPAAPDRSGVNVSLHTTTTPKYVIPEQPLVLRDSTLPINYRKYTGKIYDRRTVSTADELPVDPYQQGPECPPLNQSTGTSPTE